MGRGDSSMPSIVMSSKRVLPDKARVGPRRVAPTTVAGVVVWSRRSKRIADALHIENAAFPVTHHEHAELPEYFQLRPTR